MCTSSINKWYTFVWQPYIVPWRDLPVELYMRIVFGRRIQLDFVRKIVTENRIDFKAAGERFKNLIKIKSF